MGTALLARVERKMELLHRTSRVAFKRSQKDYKNVPLKRIRSFHMKLLLLVAQAKGVGHRCLEKGVNGRKIPVGVL